MESNPSHCRVQGSPGQDTSQQADGILAAVFSGVPAKIFRMETQRQRMVTFRFKPEVPAAEVAAADAMFRELPYKVSPKERREEGRTCCERWWGAGGILLR